jgi:hypothetical protein
MNFNPNPTGEEIRKSQAAGKTLQERRTATTNRITSAGDTALPKQQRPALLVGAVILLVVLAFVIVLII